MVRETLEIPSGDKLKEVEQWRAALGPLLQTEELAEQSWYKFDLTDIPILDRQERTLKPLSEYSNVVKNMQPIGKVLLYVKRKDYQEANRRLQAIKRREE